jgi:hypothetical protein
MKKLFLSTVLAAIIVTSVSAAEVSTNRYKEKATATLNKSGYAIMSITGPISGYCTIARGIFDWNAANFVARNSKGEVISGAVCGGQIYITGPDIATL